MLGQRPLLDDEIPRVERAFGGPLGPRNRALFVLGLRTGFRVRELLSLRLGDVLDETGAVTRLVRVERRHMKGKRSGRTVPIHDHARRALGEWVAILGQRGGGLDRSGPLFPSRVGSKALTPSGAHRALKAAFRGFPGPLSTHSMRKSFARKIHRRLGDVAKTQLALGHANIATTLRYLSFDRAEIDAAILGVD
jgi:integrase